ncbi:MAG: efflux RND transporter periplasmic adaptor subunit [Desulfobacterales bacterium]|nr:efflux RND transporter periplasmic adaptor subunit [Desulfobacterales bacterium]
MKKLLILVVFFTLLIGVGTLVYMGQRQEGDKGSYYSGTIEATQADLAFNTAGRVESIWVDEGQSIKKGQILAELESAEFSARRDLAQARLEQSLEHLNQLQAVFEVYQSTLPAEVERAEAAVTALQAQRDELEAGYRIQEVQQARLALEAAQSTYNEARKDKIRYDKLFQEKIIAEKDKDVVDLKFELALKAYERAKEDFDLLQEGFRKQTIDVARAKLAEGRAVLLKARGNLKTIEATAGEVAAAKANVQAARSELELANIQLAYTKLQAPFEGILTSRNLEPGEVVSASREVFSLADLSKVDLKVYIDETEIGKIKPGQTAEVRIDTFADKIYTGRVAFISPEGEFTPKMIQTQKERVKLVYLVKIAILNPDFELKPGMLADAWFR